MHDIEDYPKAHLEPGLLVYRYDAPLFFANAELHQVWPIFGILVTLGLARAFLSPANQSLAPNLVPPPALASAITLNSMSWQFANVVGPMAGGLLYGVSAGLAYGVAAAMIAMSAALILLIPMPARREGRQTTSVETLLAGFRYIWKEKIVLGAISLDMFAVLLGGAVALLPVYARDILETGPWGLGLLRAAPGVGGIIVALILTRFPVRDRAGLILFFFVAAFGASTIVFGFSTTLWIAVPALFLIGATDMISVVIRETLIQLWTPDELRGRVSAVNFVFIGASNELGEFRAGVVAAGIGAVAAVTL
ncbi:MAG: MFS transporter, partial [Cucumibacter sp.]